MKRFLTVFCLLVLLSIIYSNSAYAQLPFGPFSVYSSNPAVPATPGTWDQSAIWWANAVVVNDTFYLTYNGTNNFPGTPPSTGLALSTDGLTFLKSPSNPIISGDGSGFDAYSAANAVLFFDNTTWYIYYGGKSVTSNQPSDVVGRATSNNPHGPWTKNNNALLSVGSAGEWDSGFIIPSCVIQNGTMLLMYHIAGSSWPGIAQIGLATSVDNGNTWQKYDNPATSLHPFAESDPVLKPDKPYDNNSLWGCTVLKTPTQLQMFYAGDNVTVSAICYATSVDGINWVKDDLHNPIFVPSQDPLAAYNIFEQPSVIIYNNKYFMYYDYGVSPSGITNGIGLAMADNVIPVELISFTVRANDKEVTLNWSTATELNNQGFEVQRKYGSNNFVTIGSVIGNGTTTSPNQYIFIDKLLDPGKYFYRLKQLDFNGTFEFSNTIEVDVRSVDKFTLEQNFPNPFNPVTTIGYVLQEKCKVKLILLNSLGEEIALLINEEQDKGYHKVEFDAKGLPSGIYFYRLNADNFVKTKKMLLIR